MLKNCHKFRRNGFYVSFISRRCVLLKVSIEAWRYWFAAYLHVRTRVTRSPPTNPTRTCALVLEIEMGGHHNEFLLSRGRMLFDK